MTATTVAAVMERLVQRGWTIHTCTADETDGVFTYTAVMRFHGRMHVIDNEPTPTEIETWEREATAARGAS